MELRRRGIVRREIEINRPVGKSVRCVLGKGKFLR